MDATKRPCVVPIRPSEPWDDEMFPCSPPPPRPPPSPPLPATPAVSAVQHTSQNERDERARMIWAAVCQWRSRFFPRPKLAELFAKKMEAVKKFPPLRGTTTFLPTPAPRSPDPPLPPSPPPAARAKRPIDDVVPDSEEEDDDENDE